MTAIMSKEQQESSHFVLAYYLFTNVPDPHQEVANHKIFFQSKQLTSRIYISESGINGQMSGLKSDAEAYIEWIRENPLFKNIIFKIHPWHEQVFPRQTIKYRKQLVALDEEVDLSLTGEHVSAAKWKALIEGEQKPLLLDVRNDYEWEVGRFENAVCPPCETFREFGHYAKELKNTIDPETTPVMMYCTGGIRCELYSSLLIKEGFKKVYQLDGGVIQYGLTQGSDHWLGKLFVFDDRLTVPISDEKTPVIGTCHLCNASTESYYNCANMDCNRLFLCCPDCVKQLKGSCSTDCGSSPRLRPYQQETVHKPFRKWHHYFTRKIEHEKTIVS